MRLRAKTFHVPFLILVSFYSHLPAYEDGTDSVPKRRHIKFRRRVITQKKAYNTIANFLPDVRTSYSTVTLCWMCFMGRTGEGRWVWMVRLCIRTAKQKCHKLAESNMNKKKMDKNTRWEKSRYTIYSIVLLYTYFWPTLYNISNV